MPPLLALEINDAGLRLARAGTVLADSPGFALPLGREVVTGSAAREQAWLDPNRVETHFWQRLQTSAARSGGGRHYSHAELACHHLRQLWSAQRLADEPVVVAVPGNYQREQLALLLGILQRVEIPIHALVDAALAATASAWPDCELVYLDIDLHQALITPLRQGVDLQAGVVGLVADAGQLDCERVLCRAIAGEFVHQTRFDPLHSALGEQELHLRLAQVLVALRGRDSVTMTMESGNATHRIVLKTAVLERAARGLTERICRQVDGCVRAGRALVVQLSDRAAALPGLATALHQPARRIESLAYGAAVLGAARLDSGPVDDGGAWRFRRRIRLPKPVAAERLPSPAELEVAASPAPTHLLWDNRAWPLGEEPLAIGSDPADATRVLRIGEGIAGVRRHHCSIHIDHGRAIFDNPAGAATRLNDQPAPARAALQIGDRIGLGELRGELLLIAVRQT